MNESKLTIIDIIVKRKDLWRAILLPLMILALSTFGVSLYAYSAAKKIVRQNIANDMEAIARLKVAQIEQWLNGRRDDALLIETSQFSIDLQEWLAGDMRDPQLKQRLLEQMQIPDTYQHRHLSLRSSIDGRLLLTTDGATDFPTERQQAISATMLGKTLLEDIHLDSVGNHKKHDIGFFSPVFGSGDPGHKQTLAILHLRMDPDELLFPLLQQWPGASQSAETLLLRKEGNEVVFLNTLRHIHDSPLSVRRSLAIPHFIPARVVTEGAGFLEDNDYRGVPTLAYGLTIAGTPWFLIAKIDRDEAYSQLNTIAAFASVLLWILLLFCAWWLLERKRKELLLSNALRESEDLYQNAPCGYHSVDKNGMFLRINDTELKMLGYSRNEIVGKMHLQDLHSNRSLARFNETFSQFKECGQINNLELEFTRKDGTLIPVLVSATALKDSKGQFLMSRSMIYDLTEQKRTEVSLRVSEERFRTLFGSIRDAVFVHEMSADGMPGGFIEVNDVACERLGYSRDELLALRPIDIDAPDSMVDIRPIVEQLAAGRSMVFEQIHQARDGRQIPVEVSANTFTLQGKNLVIALVHDISERKLAEENFRLSRRAIESSFNAFIITTAASNAGQSHPLSYPITYVNPAFERITGYTVEEVLGKTPRFLQGTDDDQPDIAKLNLALREQHECRVTLRNYRKNGSLFWNELLIGPVWDANGKVTHYVGIINDITEHMEIERKLIDSREELRKLAIYDDGLREEERKHIAREVHDELGQLLTVLKMDISLLQMQFDKIPGLVEKTEEMRLLVENTIRVVRHIVSDLRPAALDMGIAGALEWLGEDFSRHTGIRCSYKGPETDPAIDDKIATAIFRIAQESLTNVARHASATTVSMHVSCSAEELRLSVEDDGSGFDPVTILQRKDAFGLLGMRERVAALKGMLHIDSCPGKGTRIVIEVALPERTLQ